LTYPIFQKIFLTQDKSIEIKSYPIRVATTYDFIKHKLQAGISLCNWFKSNFFKAKNIKMRFAIINKKWNFCEDA
jgi:hypothetical protein